MSTFKIPLTLCRRIADDVLKYWWNNGKGRGIHWIKADKLYNEKSDGGLGFQKFKLTNLALLAKQGWRLLTRPDLLLTRMLKAKYFPESDLLSALGGSRPSFAWRGILEGLEIVKSGAQWDARERKYKWLKDGSGMLTVKSAYWRAVDLYKDRTLSQGEQSDKREVKRFWTNLWKLRIPNKIKLFAWRLYHDSLPTMHNLAKKGINVNNRCSHCGFRNECALHIFKECWWTQCLLQVVRLPVAVWDNHCDNAGYWLWLCAKLCSEEQYTSLVCGLWLGWKDRNDIVHEKDGRSLKELKLQLTFMLKEFKEACSGSRLQKPWLSYDSGSDTQPLIFCDASFDVNSSLAGFGAVLLLEGLVWAVHASWSDEVASVFEAECKAIKLGMKLAERLSLPKVRLLSDSREALWALNVGSWRSGVQLHDVRHCINELDDHPSWTLEGLPRSENAAADWLAKKARTERWEWNISDAIPRHMPRAARPYCLVSVR